MYVIYVLLKVEGNAFKVADDLNWNQFWKETLVKLVTIAVLTIFFVWFTDRESLFAVLINKPIKWLILLFVYTVFSVYPQELIYRTFYFQRYRDLFQNKKLLIFINAFVFSLAHLFFRKTLVLLITFIGGLLFALTFHKTKSTLLVSIEHAIYGCWLFTVGMGEMLGFPS
jgi:membrane protease YdiL (CAAX protease family)